MGTVYFSKPFAGTRRRNDLEGREMAILVDIELEVNYIASVHKETKRRLLAALFLICFFAEVGSHVVICAAHSPGVERSFSSSDRGHDDPCRSLVLCSDSRRGGKQGPTLGHDASQHNPLFDVRCSFLPPVEWREKTTMNFSARFLRRARRPHFHPPQPHNWEMP